MKSRRGPAMPLEASCLGANSGAGDRRRVERGGSGPPPAAYFWNSNGGKSK